MSNWGRSPRGGNGMETAQALNVWRETCAQEKEHRRASLSKLGLKALVHQPPAKGTIRSDPPLRYSYLFASPRATTAQEAALMHKQPGALPIRYLIPDPDDPVDKTYNRKKSEFDYSDDSRGDHEIFPRDHRDVGRKKIRDLKAQVPPLLAMAQWHDSLASNAPPRVARTRAQVSHEKQARRDAERRLQWHQEFGGDVPMPSPRVATLAEPAASAALLHSGMLSPRGVPEGFAWVSQVALPERRELPLRPLIKWT